MKAPKRKTGVLFKLILRIIVLTLAAALLISFSAGYIAPSDNYLPALAGLAFPYLWSGTLLISIVFLIFRQKKQFILLLIPLMLAIPVLTSYFSFDLAPEPKSPAYEIFSFNTFGLRKPYAESNQLFYQDSLNSFLNSGNYTVACFQEYPMKGAKHAGYYSILMEGMNLPYKALSEYYWNEKSTKYILIIASRFPIIDHKTIYYQGLPFAMYADIRFPEKVVRVYNVHMMSVKLLGEKKLLMLDKGGSVGTMVRNIKIAVNKLITAFEKRQQQSQILNASMKDTKLPIIITGDFNDTPVSYTYHKLKKGLKDASDWTFTGIDETYKLSRVPLQIDYIFHDKSFRSTKFQKIDLNFSDHYAISATISPGN